MEERPYTTDHDLLRAAVPTRDSDSKYALRPANTARTLPASGELVLCELRPVVREVHGTRLDKSFEIADDEQKVLSSF